MGESESGGIWGKLKSAFKRSSKPDSGEQSDLTNRVNAALLTILSQVEATRAKGFVDVHSEHDKDFETMGHQNVVTIEGTGNVRWAILYSGAEGAQNVSTTITRQDIEDAILITVVYNQSTIFSAVGETRTISNPSTIVNDLAAIRADVEAGNYGPMEGDQAS